MVSHAAPGTSGGIYFQLERALLRLAEGLPGDVVGIETDDDVAVRRQDGSAVNEQDKLSFQSFGHPFQDRGMGLWNTLMIWLDASANGTPYQRCAQLSLVTTHNVPRRALAARIGAENKSESDIQQCIQELRSIAQDPRDDIAKLTQRVTAYDDEMIAGVIRRVRLEDGAGGAAGSELRARTVSLLHLHPDVDGSVVVQSLLGWLQDTLMNLWRARQPGWIDRASFDRQLHAIQESLRRTRKRERAATFVTVSKEDRERNRTRAFVERLIDIQLEREDIDTAIDDFMRFHAEHLRLSAEGDVVPDDWTSFFDNLDDRWRSISRRNKRSSHAEGAEALGRKIYSETVEEDYRAPLGGQPTEHRYFTAGGYHASADAGRVHWHPNHSSSNTSGMGQCDNGTHS